MDIPRLPLAGLVAALLMAVGIAGVFRQRLVVESPGDLARTAIHGGKPDDRARAAARLAAVAARPPDGMAADTIACLKELLLKGDRPEVRAAAVVGLARTGDRTVLPLIVAAIEDDDPLVAGRAVGAAQHLLGVRYGTDEKPFDREARRRLAAMAKADMAALDGPGRTWWDAHTVQGATW